MKVELAMSFTGKKAVVLGGTSAIGLATAAALKEQGANVVVAGRSAENINRARECGLEYRKLMAAKVLPVSTAYCISPYKTGTTSCRSIRQSRHRSRATPPWMKVI